MSINMAIAEPLQTSWMEDSSVGFERWGQEVSGWFKSPADLSARPGILVVATPVMDHPCILAVEAADNICQHVSDHADARLWRTAATGGLMYAAIYTDTAASRFVDRFMRETLASHIRSIENPVFGVSDVLA